MIDQQMQTMTPDAASYVQDIQAQKQAEALQANRADSLRELLEYCNGFIKASAAWRLQSFESQWHRWQRNADSIYDPVLKAAKESWQSKAFIPITPSHRETIQAALFRTMVGARPPLEVRSRVERQDDQSDNIRDLILREMEKSHFELELNKVLDDATTYGSGFARVRHETRLEDRRVKQMAPQQIDPMDQAMLAKSMAGQLMPQFKESIQPVEVYRGVRFEHLSIWDIFPDPRALTIEGNAIALRYRTTYGEIVKGVAAGYYLPECAEPLKDIDDGDKSQQDENAVKADRQISEQDIERNLYDNALLCHELQARLPKRLVLINGEDIDDPEKLISAVVRFHKNAVVAVEVSDAYDGEPNIYKMDYMPVNGQFFARGIPEMLKDVQEIANETVNQRIDNVGLSINKMFAVIEKALVDRGDLVSKPGMFLRLDAKYVQDVRQAVMEFNVSDVTRSAYEDVREAERYGQERTSVNSVTLGTQGQLPDGNDTASGMAMVKQASMDKFAYIGTLMEFDFLHKIYRAYWKTTYANLRPEDVIDALGEKRALTFKLMTPEQIENEYEYEPQGIYTMENKNQSQARLANIWAQFAGQPWLNPMAVFDREVKANNIDPDSLKYSPEEMQQMMQAQMHLQMAQGQGGQPQGSGNPEKDLDHAAAKVAVGKGLVSPADAAGRLKLKHG